MAIDCTLFFSSVNCNLCFVVLKWKSEFELRLNDYIAQRVGKAYPSVLIHNAEESFVEIIEAVVTFEHIEQLKDYHSHHKRIGRVPVFVGGRSESTIYRPLTTEGRKALRQQGCGRNALRL